VPAFAEEEDFLIWDAQLTGYPNPEDGVTTFEVLTDGPVLMAVTDEERWGWGYNDEPITTRAQLEAQGWVEFAGGLIVAHTGYTYPEGSWQYIVFRRDSVAGETFTYRTERYCPPVIIRSERVIPEPSSFIVWSLLAALGVTVAWWRRRRP
jgi:hypothetical protein